MSPFEYLGLRPEADEREVRKAYARLLKSNRPDDDPVAFQQVNQAFQAALELLRRRRWEEAQDTAEAESAHAPGPRVATAFDGARAVGEPASAAADRAEARVPTPHVEDAGETQAEPAFFDLRAFMDELFLFLETRRADEVSAWLYAQPALYSIQLKSAITVDVLRLVAERQPPVSARALQAVSDFFGVDNLGPSGWWLTERIDRARHRAEVLERFKRVPMPRTVYGEGQKLFDLKIDEEVVRPPSAWRTAVLLATPGMPTRVRDRMREVDALSEGVANELMDPARRALYFELADRSLISRKRMGLSLARNALFGGGLALLSFGVDGDASILLAVGVVALCFLAWQLCVAGLLKLQAKLAAAGQDSVLREAFALLCLAGGLTLLGHPSLQAEWSGFGYWWLIGAACIATTRIRLKAGIPLALVLMVPDLVISARYESHWPFQAGSFSLALLTPLVLGLDRIRSWRSKVPVSVLAKEVGPLAWMLAVATGLSVVLVYAALILSER